MLLLGKIVKPQGIKGQIKIASEFAEVAALKRIKYVYIDDIRTSVSNIRCDDLGYIFLQLSTVVDRNAAELLRNKLVYIDDSQLPSSATVTLVADVLGCKVYLDDETFIGEVVEILTNRNTADVYYVKKQDGKELCFPFLKKLVVLQDMKNKKIVLNRDVFAEVCFDED